MKRRGVYLLGLLSFIALLAALGWGYRIVTIGKGSMLQNAGMVYVCDSMGTYVAIHKRWPASWEELGGIPQTSDKFVLPRDKARLEAVLLVDFDAKLSDVAASQPKNFAAIKPLDAPFYNYEGLYSEVISAAKKAYGTHDVE